MPVVQKKFKKGTGLPAQIPNVIKLRVKMPGQTIIRRLMTEGFRQALQEAYTEIASSMTTEIQTKFLIKAKQSAEYSSLIHGALRAHLGLESPDSQVDPIINRIASGILVQPSTVKVVGRKFIGGLNLFLLQEDFIDILGMSEASYISEPSKMTIPWLEWLLFGTQVTQVHTHHIELGPATTSRSGNALMIKGGGWSMAESGYSGTNNDNWFTRIFDDLKNDINRILYNELSHVI